MSSNHFAIQDNQFAGEHFCHAKNNFFSVIVVLDNVHVTDKSTTKEISLIYSFGGKCGIELELDFTH